MYHLVSLTSCSMTTRRKNTRKSKSPPRQTSSRKVIQPQSSIRQIFNAAISSEEMEHFKYFISRLRYLLIVIGMGFLIQWGWNAAMDAWFDGDYEIGLFEAAILWVCVY